MEKICVGRYPKKEQEQNSDITKSLASMLNCRRYLTSQGFTEKTDDCDYRDSTNCIGGIVYFPDGSKINHESFVKSVNRDGLLERMISKGVRFVRHSSGGGYCTFKRDRVARTSFGDDNYRFTLSVIDTTREQSFFPVKIFLISPRKFSFNYQINLDKDVITDTNLQEFEKYQQGLEDAMKQDALLTYSPQVPQRKSVQAQEVEMPQVETQFINPWEVKIPKLGKNE